MTNTGYVKKPCKICGKVVTAYNSSRPALCSAECRRLNYNKLQLEYKERHLGSKQSLPCTICGKPDVLLTRRTDRAVLCSDECRVEHKLRYVKKTAEERTKRIPAPCVECGKETLTPAYRGVPLCSSECRKARKSKVVARQRIEKLCKICDTPVVVYNGGNANAYCSDECRQIGKIENELDHRERTRPPRVERECSECGHPVLTRRKSKCVTCSPECAKAYRKRYNEEYYEARHPTVIRPCRVCGVDVETRKKTPICSEECFLEEKTTQAREWQRAKALKLHGPMPSCGICGVQLKRRKSEYCKECKPPPTRRPKPPKPPTGPMPSCVTCGIELSRRNGRYCKECNPLLRSDPPQDCIQCGKKIEGRRASARFCSDECLRLRNIERSKEYRQSARGIETRRLRRKNRKHKAHTAAREKWWENQGGKCYLCGLEIKKEHLHERGWYHLEHGMPRSRGGREITGLACAECNIAKGKRTVEEYLASDKSEPPNNPLTRYPDWGPFDWASIR